MTLAALQHEFMAQVLEDDCATPSQWDARMEQGLAIYRNAYRTRLIDTLRETFPRTVRWVGEDAFNQAGAHHLITRPPDSWTLDLTGNGFAETLAALFRHDREVAELAQLEWAMHIAFTAADAPALDADGFVGATSGFDDADWDALNLRVVPSLRHFRVSCDCVALWQALMGESPPEPPPQVQQLTDGAGVCVVWRVDHDPLCEIWPSDQASVLLGFVRNDTLGTICERLSVGMPADEAAQIAGNVMARMMASGMIEAIA